MTHLKKQFSKAGKICKESLKNTYKYIWNILLFIHDYSLPMFNTIPLRKT